MQQLLLTDDLIHIRVRGDNDDAHELAEELERDGYRILRIKVS